MVHTSYRVLSTNVSGSLLRESRVLSTKYYIYTYHILGDTSNDITTNGTTGPLDFILLLMLLQ